MASQYYGLLESRNINRVRYGDLEFDTWYGNAAYFHSTNHTELGFRLSDFKKVAHAHDSFWLDTLHVCEFCFKYTNDADAMRRHRALCQQNTPVPHVGSLVYRDRGEGLLVRKVRGFQQPLFCQNLCLFSKLFLDDKSVYYNVDHFDFYVVYGREKEQLEKAQPSAESSYIPLGFFSKEMLSYDNDNNLACICVFPPFQRRRLGSFLIELSYEVAKHTPGQARSGPEFPLSPYGRLTYLHFWSKRLCYVIDRYLASARAFSLEDVATITGYRKEDVLFTLEYMRVLTTKGGKTTLHLGNFRQWCVDSGFSPQMYRKRLKKRCLVL